MPTDLYAALATSASVFLGILTALLVSDLSNLKSERSWISRQIEGFDAKLQGLNQERVAIEDKTVNIEEPRYTEKPRFSPEREFYRESEESQAANVQADIQSARRHNRNHRRWLQLRSRRQALTDERQQLTARYKALDPSTVTPTLKASVVAIALAVVVPSLAFLLRILEVAPEVGPSWVQPVSVFVVWLGGLGYVFAHLYSEITTEPNGLPQQSSDSGDTDTPGEHRSM